MLHAFADAGQWRSGHLGEAEAAAPAEPPVARPAPGGVVLDDLDRALLARLGEDARQSHAALAAAVGTPEPTVRRRLYRLDGAGLVRSRVTDTLGPLGVGRAETTIVARAVKRAGVPPRRPRARA
ncbi:Lrp/AsnC family transcriptional regulator [Kitasatospora sp. NPDC001527]|uniref:Lrp/AsnC family transcriptional regulator n=1 Tax=Kitasatospora sp. NPDC001527 TaxID=3154519 RepID=UPI00331F9596